MDFKRPSINCISFSYFIISLQELLYPICLKLFTQYIVLVLLDAINKIYVHCKPFSTQNKHTKFGYNSTVLYIEYTEVNILEMLG